MYGDPSTLIDQTRNLLLAYGNPMRRSVLEARMRAAKGGTPFPKKVPGARNLIEAISQTYKTAAARAKEQGLKITGYQTVRSEPYIKGVSRFGKGKFFSKRVTDTYKVPIYGLSKEQFQKEQAEFTKKFQETAEATQADIARQLKIIQEEKSAVSKLSQEYSDMLIKEAEAKRKAQEEAQIALRTDRANLARAGQRGSLQIQPAGSTPRTTAGTQQFRRRAVQFGGGTPYKGLSQISSGMVNV